LAILAGPAKSQSSPPADPAALGDLDLEQLMALKVATVFGASKYEQSTADAPASVTIITDDEILKHGYRTLADALRSVRGVSVRYDRNYSYAGVRGFDRAGDSNTRILLLVDGHRVAENFLDGNYLGTEFLLDADLIDHVEVIRGPGSALYGSNAFIAVVNVVSKRGPDVGPATASVSAGGFGTYRAGFAAGSRPASRFEYLVSASALRSDGAARLYFAEFDSSPGHGGIATEADGDEARSVMAKASYGGFSLETLYNRRKKGIPSASYGTVFGDSRTETVDSTGFLDLGYRHQSAGGLSTQAHVSFNRQTYDGVYIYDIAQPGEPAALVRNIDEQVGEWYGAELQFARRMARGHRLVGGVEFRDNTRQQAANFDEEPLLVYSSTDRQSRTWGVFVQDEVALSAKVSLTAGMRHDHYAAFGGTTNPRLALICKPSAVSVVKVLYGQAFRAPSLYETYWADPATKPNPGLRPEKIATMEWVYERMLPASFALSISAYHSRIDDLIGQEADPEDGLLANRNLSSAETRGVEFELARNLANGLEGRVSWALQRAEDRDTGRSLENSPHHLGRLTLRAPLRAQLGAQRQREGLFLGLDAQFSSSVETIKGGRVDGFWLANATLLWRPRGRGAEFSASAYNLFDESYAYAVGDEHVPDAISQDGRTYQLKFTQRF
jgi:iron complex outermembrane receptor protein